MNINDAVAPDTAMDREKMIRKIEMKRKRKLANDARINASNSVVGTVYRTKVSERIRLFIKTGVANSFLYCIRPTNMAGRPIGSVM